MTNTLIALAMLAGGATIEECDIESLQLEHLVEVKSVCHAGTRFYLDKETLSPVSAVYISKPKLQATPIIDTTWNATTNLYGNKRAKDLFKKAIDGGDDYAHLVDPLTVASTPNQAKLLQADVNRLPMAPSFNRTGLYKQLERYEQQQKLTKGTLSVLAGYFTQGNQRYFYKSLFQNSSHSHITFILPEVAEETFPLDHYISSISCVQQASGNQYVVPKAWDVEPTALAYSIDIWAMGQDNRNQDKSCKWKQQ